MSLNLTAEDLEPETDSFWRRQFSKTSTEPQVVFDFVFCLVAPLLCFYFDPVVFKGGLIGNAVLGPFQVFAYGVTAVEVTLFVLWMLSGSRLGAWSRLIGAALISGAVFSAVIGLRILPYSLMGLLVVIGILGFIPFLTAFSYLRVGWRAFKSEDKTPASSPIIPLLVGVILSLALPALVSVYVSRTTANSLDAILHGSPKQAELAVGHLKWLPFVPQENLDSLVNAYMNETDPARLETLKKSYLSLTGEDLERRVAILND